MPASLYEYCRKSEHKPIKVGGGFVLPTDRQTQTYLLCETCEDLLNKGGEAWIADKLATWECSFPLYDMVTEQPADFNEEGMTVYFLAKNSAIKVDKLKHLALGLFWKASVDPWSGKQAEPRIELGLYSEKVRRWLIGESEFPVHMYLIAVISPPLRAQITLNDPYEGRRQGWRSFFVHVPGLLFMLAVGKTVDPSTRWLCIHNNPHNPIVISDQLTTQFQQGMVTALRRARKTNAFLKAYARVEKERETFR